MTAEYLYLKTPIAEAKRTHTPRHKMAADGYTTRSGAPTSLMIRLEGQRRWRRVMCWQFSNACTLFVRVNGNPFVVRKCDIPEPTKETHE